MQWRLLFLFLLIGGLAACKGDDNKNLVIPGGGDTSYHPSTTIDWDHSPYTIVFRAEVLGGEDADAFYRRNDVPYCTIYGDGRLVWTTETGAGFQVLYDQISDQQIVIFVDYLITQRLIYNYTAEANLDFSAVAPVVEVLTLNVNNTPFQTDAFGGWDYAYFEDILANCQALGQQPTIFEATEGWLSAQAVTYDAGIAYNLWSVDRTGIDLGVLASTGERRWITGDLARAVWLWLYRSGPNLQFGQGDAVYNIALEAPGVTHVAPPPPSAQ